MSSVNSLIEPSWLSYEVDVILIHFKEDTTQITLRFHLTPVSDPSHIQGQKQQQMLARMLWNRNTYSLVVGMQISTTTMENSMEVLKKLNIELPCHLVVPLLGVYPKDRIWGHNRDTCMSVFIAALFIVAKLCKQPRCHTTDEWIKKI
jgi:hypothetical protein